MCGESPTRSIRRGGIGHVVPLLWSSVTPHLNRVRIEKAVVGLVRAAHLQSIEQLLFLESIVFLRNQSLIVEPLELPQAVFQRLR